MIPSLRQAYLAQFDEVRYNTLLQHMADTYEHMPPFKVAETPVFIPNELRDHLLVACRQIVEQLQSDAFRQWSVSAIPTGKDVPGETSHTTFLQIDFGVCQTPEGDIVPQLIEIQGFPSLYAFQYVLGGMYKQLFDIPENKSHLLSQLEEDSYFDLLRRTLLDGSAPENTILLEVEPEKQATQIDFRVTKALFGIPAVCLTKVEKEGKKLYYRNEEGERIPIHRIYNRVIFDELDARTDIAPGFSFSDELDVHWVGHPNWFFKISKHTLPFLQSTYVPASYLLNDLKGNWPEDLDQFVLKPLYSFAGQGVEIHVTTEKLEAIEQPEHYILQRKVNYAPIVETLDVPATCEIRMMLLWPDGDPEPTIAANVTRLSKGEMIGVRFNKGKTWVGGSVSFFEKTQSSLVF